MNKQNEYCKEEIIKKMTGRTIKHPTAIRDNSYASRSLLSDTKKEFVSADIESDYETGDTHLLGFYDGKRYWYYENNFLSSLVQVLDYFEFENRTLTYWSKFDPTQLLKIMLDGLDPNQQEYAINSYQKITSQWNKKEKKWSDPPIIERKIRRKYYGICSAIRSNLQFFTRKPDENAIGSIWSYNIAPFYTENLEPTAKRYLNFEYSKISEKAHLLNSKDWDRFHNPKSKADRDFREMVLLSNEMDAKACYYLSHRIMDDFANIFYGRYPKSLISTGSLTRASIQAVIEHENSLLDLNDKQRKTKTLDDLQSICFEYHKDKWRKQLGDELFNNFYSLCFEIYKGAKIECYGYGYYKNAFTADITMAYPDEERNLKDLRGSIITHGYGEPPEQTPNSYIMIRGMIDIPKGTEYHTFLIRNPMHPEGNLCPDGKHIKTTYWKEERDQGLSQGIKFYDEEWFKIETNGEKSVLAIATDKFIDKRFELRSKNDPNEKIPKQSASGIYGVGYQAIKIYTTEQKDDNIKIIFDGLRGGQFLNPIYSSRITMKTRLKIAKASLSIVKNGGKPIFAQTDAITWFGNKNQLDAKFWRKKKTVGFFEEPTEIHDLISLGAGRYEYYKTNEETGKIEKYIAKTRGVYLDRVLDLEDVNIAIDYDDKEYTRKLKRMILNKQIPENKIVDVMNWADALQKIDKNNKINIVMQTLVTPGILKKDHDYTIADLGRIVPDVKSTDAISGKNKRKIEPIYDYKSLSYKHYWSEPITITGGIILGSDIIDDTLPDMRKAMQDFEHEEKEIKQKKRSDMQKTEYRDKYWLLRKHGHNVEDAKKFAYHSWSEVFKLADL